MSYSRIYRLASKEDFQSVFAKPHKATRKNLLALYRSNQLSHPRLGIIIGKHIIKHAVDRNRLRRVIRESFRHHQDALKGLDIVVLVRSKWSTLEKKAIREDIDNLWQALKIPSKPV